MHVAMQRAGWRGLIAGGLGFILPTASITLFFVWLYKEYGSSASFGGVLYSVQPGVIAVVVQAMYGLAQPALKPPLLWAAALAASSVTGWGSTSFCCCLASLD